MTKKILIVDKPNNNTELLELIFTNYSEFKVETEFSYEHIISNYKNDKYEYIIFDHSSGIADKLMNYILANNPTQKCILLSDSISCPISCEQCLNTFKFIRLIKPLNPKDILFYIDKNNEYTCPNKNVFDSVDTLGKLYKFLNLEHNTYYREKSLLEDSIVIKPNKNTNLKIDELDKLQQNINNKYFNFQLMLDNSVKIVKI